MNRLIRVFVALLFLQTMVCSHPFDLSVCGSTKLCVVQPSTCDISAVNSCAEMFATFTTMGEHVQIEMWRRDTGSGADKEFVAVGFSNDQRMGDDTVTECVFDRTTEKAMGFLSRNPAYNNERITDTQGDLMTLSGGRSDGDYHCTLKQRIQPKEQDRTKILALNQPFYILTAMGTAQNDRIDYHSAKWPGLQQYTITSYISDAHSVSEPEPETPAVIGEPTSESEPEPESHAEPPSSSNDGQVYAAPSAEPNSHAEHAHDAAHSNPEPETQAEGAGEPEPTDKVQKADVQASKTSSGSIMAVSILATLGALLWSAFRH